MTILDRYILKHFLINYLILFGVLYLFTCMVQLFVNLDRFVEAAEIIEGGDPNVSTVAHMYNIGWLIADYYIPQLAQFFAFLAGMITIGAMGFTLVQLHRNRELVALLAAGVSLHRAVMSIIIAGLVICLLQFANRELILPHLGPRLLRDYGQLGQPQVEGFSVQMAPDGQGRLFYAQSFAQDSSTMSGVVIWQQNAQGSLEWRIRADSATWDEQRKGWELENGVRQRLASVVPNPLDPPSSPPVDADDEQAASSVVLPQVQAIDFVESNLDPTAVLLRRYGEFRQMLNLNQINQLIERPSGYDVQELVRIRYGRFAQVLVNVLTLLIALPFFMLREPRNLVIQSVLCSGVGLTAQIAGAIGVAVGFPGIPAAAGAFLIPLLFLLPLAVALMGNVKT
ncbi:MAG: YjgP/YjgQ family permease [Planctomycetes bacterium]|nr:YjgP/YjgQ family permease [Planctomycetota bacterium]NOG55328.1 YjgP/YjgQ family permease [Planctomycetota bacterium]